ncbi:hypothetical protein IFT98_06000 [Pseudomonas sp. CFBP 8770]|uniref:hypothetical protein n=1 Tax=unclassified Pseudomonas TaxID=196821 RepID=UPI001783EC1A|nr:MULTISPECIES: hypothetical protein [unclassified Pseudomonas]MBD8473407.1 hypothetical protein [Pseudomonas sp. CFBP 8773]MBD8646534.1 hypothetical protein [Pseudomonas sp. CFBP 8770]
MQLEKERYELELLKSQNEKTVAEIKILTRTTPIVESVKLFGSMILGVGGVMAAIAGFQLAEVKAERANIRMSEIQAARAKLDGEVTLLEQKKADLAMENSSLEKENQKFRSDLAKTSISLDKIADKLSTPILAANPQITEIRQDLNATGLDLRTNAPVSNHSDPPADMNVSIQELFSSKARARGDAYQQIMAQYADSPDFPAALLDYADGHKGNENGVYNTLVVLSHLNRNTLQNDSKAIKAFAESVRSVGPLTSERADKLLSRLPGN